MSYHTAEILQIERGKARFPIKDMDAFINGEFFVRMREKAIKIIKTDADVFGQENLYSLDRLGKIDKSLRIEKKIVELLREKEIDENDVVRIMDTLDLTAAFDLTRSLFIPILRQHCNEDQIKRFLEPALDYRIIGCIAQTELGHGSNVQQLETTASFIKETDEFEVNSPTLTSTKWWIGTLGIAATHACVMAKLIIKDKHIGIFPIIVPVRSMSNHSPLHGINVGDVGSKMGYNSVDCGFIQFKKVRVPRSNLLQRYINVSSDGLVSIPKNSDPRIMFSTMVLNRANIASGLGSQLAKGITIAVRYTSVRRQFGDQNKQETQVLDYPIVQYRVIPILAKTYAMLGMSHEFFAQYENTVQKINQGDFSMLKEMHAVSCGLKRWSSETAVYGVDTCRHVCGGHGFSMFSGLNEFFSNIYPNIIWEGDNYVLAKQISSYLVKSAFSIKNGQKIVSNDTTRMLAKFIDPENAVNESIRYSWHGMPARTVSASKEILLDVLG
ncbi:Peroxisomal acyl-coenzyme A oxidase 1, partial [Smittium culicis]